MIKMREARFWPKMKFEPIFFQVLWQFFNPKGSLLPLRHGYEEHGAGGRKEGLGGMPPALQILGEISSNFFESTPPIRKCIQTESLGYRYIYRANGSLRWTGPLASINGEIRRLCKIY